MSQVIGLNVVGGDPILPIDRLPKESMGFAETEIELFGEEFSNTTADLNADEVLKIRIAETGNALVVLDKIDSRATKPQIEKAAAKFEAAKKKLEDARAKRAAKRALLPGNKKAEVEEFLGSPLIHRRLEFVGTTDEADDGKGPREMAEHYAKRFRELHRDRVALIKKPRPAIEIADQIDADIDRASVDVAANARSVRHVSWIEGRSGGHFEGRSFEVPSKNIPNGVGGLSAVADMGFMVGMCAAEIKRRLKALALEGHNEADAIPMGERIAKMAELDAEILQTERLAEFWYRTGRAEGISTGPRISNDIRAILDISIR